MAGLIPQSFIDDLLDRVDIVDVVDSRVKLKRTGKNYSACCPFHDEKSPSFTVSPEKQFFYCFGCGASGNALGFVMDYERLSFPEAVEQLARTAGLEVPREVQSEAQTQREQEKKNIYTLLEKADAFYQQQLRQHASKHMAINYLKGRGLDGKTAKAYGVGFAPPGWDNLLKTLAQNDDDKHLLIQGGMLIHNEQEKKLYDRFRHRIMFPIRDMRGRIIGFGGRVLGDDKPKYLNSPETPVFHKSQELYGLYEARQAYRELPRLLVVEGYMDVISLAQFGLGYGVATMGTACGPEHLERAFKYTQEVVFCFDGDKAGRNAALRALDAALGGMSDGRTVKFLFLPEGEDPDTLVRQIGPEKFERMIELAVPLEDYLFDAVAEGLNIRTMEGRASFSKRAAPLLDRLPRGVFRELMFESLATRTGLNRRLLDELITQQADNDTPLASATGTNDHAETAKPKAASEQPPILPRQEHNLGLTAHLAHTATSADNYLPDYAPSYDRDSRQDEPPPDYQHYYQSRPQQATEAGIRERSSATNRYLMPPARKALALLLANPQLASLEPDHDTWLAQTEAEPQLLGRLLKVLHERPHYNLSHIIGYWRGTYGADNTEQLAAVAGHDLLQAANALSQTRADKPAKADYDPQAGFIGALGTLKQQQLSKKSAQSLAKLKTADFTSLSKEEREQLVREALAAKLTPSSGKASPTSET